MLQLRLRGPGTREPGRGETGAGFLAPSGAPQMGPFRRNIPVFLELRPNLVPGVGGWGAALPFSSAAEVKGSYHSVSLSSAARCSLDPGKSLTGRWTSE